MDAASAAAPGDAVLERSHAATVGNVGTKVRIVESNDAACETGRAFYPTVKKFLAENPEQVRLAVRMVALQRPSGFVVRALEASKTQRRYRAAWASALRAAGTAGERRHTTTQAR